MLDRPSARRHSSPRLVGQATRARRARVVALAIALTVFWLPLWTTGSAQTRAAAQPSDLWTDMDATTVSWPVAGRTIVGDQWRVVRLDVRALLARLADAPLERDAAAPRAPDLPTREVLLDLPWPTGGFRRFRVEESPIMELPLAQQFPELKTYQGQGIDDPTATVRFDWTPSGFHALVLSAEGAVYVDPHVPGDAQYYPRPSSPGRWHLTFQVSGGFAGFDRSLQLASTGDLVVSDRTKNATIRASAPSGDLAQIGALVAGASPVEAPARNVCRDCLQYNLQIVLDNDRTLVWNLDDLNLGPSGIDPLIKALTALADRALSGKLKS